MACALFLPPNSLELREVILKDKPQALLNISPKATVPVLHLPDDRSTGTSNVIDESRDIIMWALEKAPKELMSQFLPFHLQLDIEELIDENDGPFKWALDRYKYSDRYEESEQYYRIKGEVFLAKLEQLLTQNRFLFSSEMSLADIAIFPFVRQFAHVNKAWFTQSPYIHLNHWLNDFIDSDLFISIMTKHPQWKPESEN